MDIDAIAPGEGFQLKAAHPRIMVSESDSLHVLNHPKFRALETKVPMSTILQTRSKCRKFRLTLATLTRSAGMAHAFSDPEYKAAMEARLGAAFAAEMHLACA
jgi:hypothetical protein